MPSGSLLGIGVSGLLASQAKLRTTGHNVSNTDTPGYSRQDVSISTQTPQFSGAGYQGTGVKVDTVRRVVDDYVVNQLRLDTSVFNELDSYLTNISQVDSLLADASTGLAPGIQSFFASLHAGADDPTSVPVRQLVISQAEGLTDRFSTIQGRLEQHNDTINQQLDTMAAEVTSLASGIAEMNKNIAFATSRGNDDAPNDLLDARDELLRKLSELVSVNVIQKDQNAVDVFVGNGQALVIGQRANELHSVSGQTDPYRKDLAFVTHNVEQNVTNALSGGKLGGLLDFRTNVLDKAMNSVGRVGLTLAANINERHKLGLDLNGNFGGLFFSDVNSRENMLARVEADTDNDSGNETRLAVAIDDTNLLTDTDYYLDFPGPGSERYVLTRRDTGAVVDKGVIPSVLPVDISADGFTVTIETGQVMPGDRFLIQPTRFGGRQIVVDMERPEQIAFSSAITGEASLGNEGTGKVVNTEALDVTTGSFDVPGTLNPPVVIRFTSATTYDILDNSNPSQPVDMVPPMRNLKFTPGIRNAMLPDSLGQTSVQSKGALAGRLPDQYALTPAEAPVTNGYVNETLTISHIDPVTGILSRAPGIEVTEGESAELIAQELKATHGVYASAQTRVFLTDFVNQEEGSLPMQLALNGIAINNPASLDEPSLLNPNYLADTINANPLFEAEGIYAYSDGDTLTIESITGKDINISLQGDTRDGFVMTDIHGNSLQMEGAGGNTPAVLTGTLDRSAGFNFTLGGPYTMTVALNNLPDQTITLDTNEVTGSAIAQALQDELDASLIPRGDIVVSMNRDGQIYLETRGRGEDQQLVIKDVSPAMNFALGFEPASAAGAEVRHEVTVGGIVSVVLEEGYSLSSNATAVDGNLFEATPEALPTYLGYQITIDGSPEAGDKFTVEYNGTGVSDNRNALSMIGLETQKIVDQGTVTMMDSYGRMVEFVGASTSQAQINQEASESLMQQSQSKRDGISGVNLDEEAADLIKYELAYNASAQVISIARSLFDTLINTFR
ncbi:MAG: flagellar hook-associated protein FlgK [Pseudomonadales bacterium]|nr:flagellar hook-associated protein FlgK [Pseudomonadales bacterium]